MSEIEKYESGELVYWTSIDGHIWHSDKVVQQLKDHCKQVDETNKILYQEKCDLIKENEELKDTVTCLRVELDKQKTRFKKHIAKLEQENEALKQSEQEGLEIVAELKAEKENYLQCIDEIKEAIKECKSHDYDLCINCKYETECYTGEFCSYDITNYISKILQKIKEVKENAYKISKALKIDLNEFYNMFIGEENE